MTLPHFDAVAVEAGTPYPALIDAIGAAFHDGGRTPERHVHDMPPGDSSLLIMPSWDNGEHFGVKLATVCPENAEKGLPTVNGIYVLFDARTGIPQATFDAAALTARRTAAASAYAASKLAREDASTMLMIGTGRLSRELIEAHATVRPIERVLVWGRSPDKAALVADDVPLAAEATTDRESACREADILSAATMSRDPLIHGDWLKNGAHVDLVGAFGPDMRETDAEVFRRATYVCVDTRGGARSEAGDILAAIAEGAMTFDDVAADLYEIARGNGPSRSDSDITVFKSVGSGLEDLAAATLCAASQP